LAAFCQQPRPGCSVNCSIDTATAEEGVIGGVDNGIHLLLGNIALNDYYVA
jgi:hypothetical protein